MTNILDKRCPPCYCTGSPSDSSRETWWVRPGGLRAEKGTNDALSTAPASAGTALEARSRHASLLRNAGHNPPVLSGSVSAEGRGLFRNGLEECHSVQPSPAGRDGPSVQENSGTAGLPLDYGPTGAPLRRAAPLNASNSFLESRMPYGDAISDLRSSRTRTLHGPM